MRSFLRFATASLLALTLAPLASAAPRPFSFAVVGHVRGNATGRLFVRLDALLAQLHRLHPDLVFLTGDMIWGDYHRRRVRREAIVADWERLDAAFASLGVPVYRVPGNHDLNDPVTRDVYFERYGPLPRAIRFRNALFLLLNSCYVPQGAALPPLKRPFIRGRDLDGEQIAFLRRRLAQRDGWTHAFVFLHHVLWWENDAAWWRQVHPVLREGGVRAVFAGDYGPLKFSHTRRDGIDYLQSALEGEVTLRLLQRRELSRVLYEQLDNFLWVRVEGERVEIEVKPFAALSAGKWSPERWHAIFDPVLHAPPPSARERLRAWLGGPIRRSAIALVLAATFTAGAAAGWMLRARRSCS